MNSLARNDDFNRINLNTINFNSMNITDLYDYSIWMGDLNYRINLEYDEIKEKLEAQDINYLFKFDQLNLEIDQKRLNINCFSEAIITFKPTYKLRGNSEYHKTKIPGWTDRILFKTKEDITVYSYNTIIENNSSDHKPVYAIMKFSLKTNNNIDSFSQDKLCLII